MALLSTSLTFYSILCTKKATKQPAEMFVPECADGPVGRIASSSLVDFTSFNDDHIHVDSPCPGSEIGSNRQTPIF